MILLLKMMIRLLKMMIPPLKTDEFVIANVTGATLLVIFVYAVAGMQLYGNIPQCEGNKINDHQNFANIGRSMQFLYQIATGQDFITVVREV